MTLLDKQLEHTQLGTQHIEQMFLATTTVRFQMYSTTIPNRKSSGYFYPICWADASHKTGTLFQNIFSILNKCLIPCFIYDKHLTRDFLPTGPHFSTFALAENKQPMTRPTNNKHNGNKTLEMIYNTGFVNIKPLSWEYIKVYYLWSGNWNNNWLRKTLLRSFQSHWGGYSMSIINHIQRHLLSSKSTVDQHSNKTLTKELAWTN